MSTFYQDLPVALEYLARKDKDMARAIALCGPPPRRRRGKNFRTLLYIILAQQISVKAANSIRDRLLEKLPDLTPANFLDLSDQDLREIGFSGQKIRYGRDLAAHLSEKRLSIVKLQRMEDDMAIEAITQIKGFGRWSAEIFLLFALERPDIMPAQDLALMVAAQRLKSLKARPSPKELLEIAENWRPWRSYAARFLWHYYHINPV